VRLCSGTESLVCPSCSCYPNRGVSFRSSLFSI